MIYLNSMYTQDAGAPQLPMEFFEDMTYYYEKEASNTFYDINVELYECMQSYSIYSHMKGLAGSYIYSYSKAEEIPLNVCSFETMCNADLLIDLINESDYSASLKELCCRLGYDYKESYEVIKEYSKHFDDICKALSFDEDIIINMSSVASVFIGLWFCSKVKKERPFITIKAIGNQVNVPYVAKLAMDLKIIDDVEQPCFWYRKKMSRLDVLKEIGLKEVIKKYPLYYGIRIVPYQVSFGCSSKCNFCTERMSWDKTGKIRDGLEIFEYDICKSEIEYLVDECGVEGLTFNDCTFDIRIPAFQKLGELIRKKELFFSASSRIDLIDDDYVDKMRDMNCTAMLIGLETLNKDSVRIYNKGDERYGDTAVASVKKLYENNIVAQVNIVLFHPNEEVQDVERSVAEVHTFMKKVRETNVIVPKLNVGEMVINYPSKNYFSIMSNDEESIMYHMKKPLAEIPYKVVFTSKNSIKSKNAYVQEVLADTETTEAVAFHTAALLSGHWKLFYKKWTQSGIEIYLKDKPEKETIKKCLGEYRIASKDNNLGAIRDCVFEEDEIKSFVTKVLLFSILDLIELKGRK